MSVWQIMDESSAFAPPPSPFACYQLLRLRYHRHLFYSILLVIRSFGFLALPRRLGTRFNSLLSRTTLVLLFAAAAQGQSSSITISAIALPVRTRALSFPTKAVTNWWHHSLPRPLVFSQRHPYAAHTALASRRPSAAVTMQDTTFTPSRVLRFCDIGANLLDERFMQGIYRGTYRHEADIDCVLQRAVEAGVRRIILTAGTVDESRAAVEHARLWNERYSHDSSSISDRRPLRFTCTVGVHPTRCSQVFEATPDTNAQSILDELYEICVDGMKDQTVVAIGEIGLDYDRLDFCPRDVQQKYLIQQLECLAQRTGLPLFLHNRSVGDDLYRILTEYRHCWQHATSKEPNQATDDGADTSSRCNNGGGVVHSFDDTIELASKFTNDLGLYIGLNGCSLRTEQNLETVAQLPLDRILLETDCPYCEVRSTHAGYAHVRTKFDAMAEKKFVMGQCVKNRQEPCHIVQVAEIVAGVKNVALLDVADAAYENSRRLFGWDE